MLLPARTLAAQRRRRLRLLILLRATAYEAPIGEAAEGAAAADPYRLEPRPA